MGIKPKSCNHLATADNYCNNRLNMKYNCCGQGCQLPDISLKSQDSLLYCRLFSYKYKTTPVHIHHKTADKHPRTLVSLLHFSKKIWYALAKPASTVLDRSMTWGNTYAKQLVKVPDFLETHCRQPWLQFNYFNIFNATFLLD